MFESNDNFFNKSKQLDNHIAELALHAVENVTALVEQVEVNVVLTTNPIVNRKDFPSTTYDAVLESLEVRGSSQNSSFVITSVKVPRRISEPEISKIENSLLTSIIETPNTPSVSIDVFNKKDFAKLQADVSYTIIPVGVSYTLSVLFPRLPQFWLDKTMLVDLEFLCQFYDSSLDRFSSFGCSFLQSSVNGAITCHCNHTTIFSVLLSVNSFVIPKEVRVSKIVL